MDSCGKKVYGNLRKILDFSAPVFHSCPWTAMEIVFHMEKGVFVVHGIPWTVMEIHGTTMDRYGNPWDNHGRWKIP